MNSIPIHRPKGPTMNQVPQARMPATPPRAKTAAEEFNAAMSKARKVNQRARSRIVADFGPDSRQVRDFDGDCQREYRRMRDGFTASRPTREAASHAPAFVLVGTAMRNRTGVWNIYYSADHGYAATPGAITAKNAAKSKFHASLSDLLTAKQMREFLPARESANRKPQTAPTPAVQCAADKALSDIAADLHDDTAERVETQILKHGEHLREMAELQSRFDKIRTQLVAQHGENSTRVRRHDEHAGHTLEGKSARFNAEMRATLSAVSGEPVGQLHELPAAEPEGQRAGQPRPWRDAVFFLAGVAVGGGALVALALMNPPAPTTVAVPMAIEEHGPATSIGNGIARTDDWERGISCYAHARGLSCTAMPAEAPAVAATLGKVVL